MHQGLGYVNLKERKKTTRKNYAEMGACY